VRLFPQEWDIHLYSLAGLKRSRLWVDFVDNLRIIHDGSRCTQKHPNRTGVFGYCCAALLWTTICGGAEWSSFCYREDRKNLNAVYQYCGLPVMLGISYDWCPLLLYPLPFTKGYVWRLRIRESGVRPSQKSFSRCVGVMRAFTEIRKVGIAFGRIAFYRNIFFYSFWFFAFRGFSGFLLFILDNGRRGDRGGVPIIGRTETQF